MLKYLLETAAKGNGTVRGYPSEGIRKSYRPEQSYTVPQLPPAGWVSLRIW